MSISYAILNADGQCVNRCLWDGITEWQPPEGCTAVPDPDNLYSIYEEKQAEDQTDLLNSLTTEQKTALLNFLAVNMS